MLNSPFFSVLVPNYGFKPTLFDCLDSLSSQREDKDFDSEIILLDQSPIEIWKTIAEECESKYGDTVRVLHSPVPGLFRARCDLMRYSRGQYIVFVDSDDYLDPGHLKNVFARLRELSYPDVLIQNMSECDERGKKTGIHRTSLDAETIDILDEFLYSFRLNPVPMKIFRRDLFRLEAYKAEDFGATLGEDWIFSYPLMKSARSIVFDPTLSGYCYRISPNSMSHDFSLEQAQEAFLLKDRYLDLSRLNDGQDGLVLRTKLLTYFDSCHSLVRKRKIVYSEFSFFSEKCRNNLHALRLRNKEYLSIKQRVAYALLRLRMYRMLLALFKIS